jgi:hypothetical protein
MEIICIRMHLQHAVLDFKLIYGVAALKPLVLKLFYSVKGVINEGLSCQFVPEI